MKKVFLNNATGAIIIVSPKNAYEYSSFIELFEGTVKECLDFIQDYWEENYIPDEKRVLLQD